jgi:hypothetical protein
MAKSNRPNPRSFSDDHKIASPRLSGEELAEASMAGLPFDRDVPSY